MLFGESGRTGEAVQAQLILATLLLAILPITIINVPPPTHAVTLDLWPLPDWSEPASGDTAAVWTRRPPDAREPPAEVVIYPVPPDDRTVYRIELTQTGRILFEGRPVDLVGLRMELDWLRVRNESWLELRPHPESRYELFDGVLATIGRADGFYMRLDHRPFRSAID